LQGYIHEEGHARMMLHLNPSADPMIRMRVEPHFSDEGIGVSIDGGACASEEDFAEPHERVMVSVAGFLAEIVAVGATLPPDDPLRRVVRSLEANMITALWTMDDFAKAFPGCESDVEHVRIAVQAWRPEGLDTEDNKQLLDAVEMIVGKSTAAVAAAMRVIDAQAASIIKAATSRADAHLRVVAAAMAGIATHVDAMRAASVGAYTPEMAAKFESEAARKPKTVWREAA
jgi:hypothetical protein